MSADITVKVNHRGIIRKFRVPLGTKFQDFENHLRALFFLQGRVILTYVDEDGDVITVLTDDELRDVMQSAYEQGVKSLEFSLEADSSSNADNETSANISANISVNSVVDSYEKESYVAVEEPVNNEKSKQEEMEEEPRQEMEEEPRQEMEEEPRKEMEEEPRQEEPAQEEERSYNFGEQIQTLIAQFSSIMEQNPDFIEGVKNFVGHIPQIDVSIVQETPNYFVHAHPFRGHPFYGPPGGCRRQQSRCQQSRCQQSRCRPCQPSANNQSNNQSSDQSNDQPKPESFKEKILLIQEMGFSDAVEIADLLYRYGGSVERVVEVLTSRY